MASAIWEAYRGEWGLCYGGVIVMPCERQKPPVGACHIVPCTVFS